MSLKWFFIEIYCFTNSARVYCIVHFWHVGMSVTSSKLFFLYPILWHCWQPMCPLHEIKSCWYRIFSSITMIWLRELFLPNSSSIQSMEIVYLPSRCEPQAVSMADSVCEADLPILGSVEVWQTWWLMWADTPTWKECKVSLK